MPVCNRVATRRVWLQRGWPRTGKDDPQREVRRVEREGLWTHISAGARGARLRRERGFCPTASPRSALSWGGGSLVCSSQEPGRAGGLQKAGPVQKGPGSHHRSPAGWMDGGAEGPARRAITFRPVHAPGWGVALLPGRRGPTETWRPNVTRWGEGWQGGEAGRHPLLAPTATCATSGRRVKRAPSPACHRSRPPAGGNEGAVCDVAGTAVPAGQLFVLSRVTAVTPASSEEGLPRPPPHPDSDSSLATPLLPIPDSPARTCLGGDGPPRGTESGSRVTAINGPPNINPTRQNLPPQYFISCGVEGGGEQLGEYVAKCSSGANNEKRAKKHPLWDTVCLIHSACTLNTAQCPRSL